MRKIDLLKDSRDARIAHLAHFMIFKPNMHITLDLLEVSGEHELPAMLYQHALNSVREIHLPKEARNVYDRHGRLGVSEGHAMNMTDFVRKARRRHGACPDQVTEQLGREGAGQ